MKTMQQRFSRSSILLVALTALAPAVAAQSATRNDAAENSPLLAIDNANQTETDDLGRALPSFVEVGDPKPDRYVGMFYFTWHGDNRWLPHNEYDLTEYLKTRPYFRDFTATPPGGPNNPSFYWAQPLFGYYRSTDPWAIRKHLVMLADAGVDFLFIDATNAVLYEEEWKTLLAVARDLNRAGVAVPKFTFFLNYEPEWKIHDLYTRWYSKSEYSDMWFRWRGKPLLMAPLLQDASKLRAGQDVTLVPQIQNYFTFRPTWAYHNEISEPSKWRFVHGFNAPVSHDAEGRPEQLVVNKATGGPIWDSFVEGGVSAVEGKTYSEKDYAPDWTLPDAARGVFFQNSWNRAHEAAPPITLVTGWNEWFASVWNTPGVVMLGRKTGEGQGHIVDQFNMQFNRDIEPMKGGYRDNYFWQFVANMRRYKGMRAPERVSPPKRIAVDGRFSDWNAVLPNYADTRRDIANRDHAATVPDIRYTNTSARNDIVTSKVARDGENVSFLARAAAPLVGASTRNWMWLFIDSDQNAKTGWNGYDFLINRNRSGGKSSVEQNVGGAWNWKKVGDAPSRAKGNALELSIPRALLGGMPLASEVLASTRAPLRFDFKWADNLPDNPDAMDFYSEGDVAPNTRFNYRFDEAPRVLAAAIPQDAPRKTMFSYQNPIAGSPPIRDPQITLVGDTYYMTGTGLPFDDTAPQPGIRLWSSRDLLNWKEEGVILPRTETSWYQRRFWAPEIMPINGKYWLTYNCGEKTGERQFVGLAVARKITGPYQNLTPDKPLVEGNDAHLWKDESDGRIYLFRSNIDAMEVDLEGAKIIGEPFPIIRPGEKGTWDGGPGVGLEGPFVIKRGGVLYLFYSSWGRGYEVGLATATNIRGPWTKAGNNPFYGAQSHERTAHFGNVYTQAPNIPWTEVGHGSPFLGPDGKLWISSHGYRKGEGVEAARLVIDPLHFENGTIATQIPSWTPRTIVLP